MLRSRSQARKGNQSNGKGSSTPVRAPVAAASVRRMAKPNIRNSGAAAGDIRVVHREYVGEIFGSVAFAARSHSINPGLGWEFPWLSKIAQRYESYRFNRLRYCFETESPTSTTGAVMGVIDYDSTDPAPTDKIQALNYRDAVRSPPWSDFCLEATKEDLHKRQTYFVRSGFTSEDPRLFDVGNFFLCVQGQAAATVIGELYVEYDISLMTPQVGDLGWDHAVWGEFTGSSNSAPAATVKGNLPVTVESTGTTTSVTTFTFTGPWEGFLSLALVGSTLSNYTTNTGTVTITDRSDVVNSAATQESGHSQLKAVVGDTLIVTIPNATITSSRFSFGQGDPV